MPLNLNGPLLKICGLLTYNEACHALECGANAVGFLVGLRHRADDQVGIDTAREIVERLPAGTNAVLVTHLLDVDRIAELAGYVGVSAIQLHDSVLPKGVMALRMLAPDKTILKAVHVTGKDALKEALSYQHAAEGLLLDSRTADRIGGTGQTHDWSISREIVEAVAPLPVYLAGGLNPKNVAAAIRQVRPAGVDVNSGVEDAQGGKSRERMAAFVAAARAAFAE